MSDVDVLVLGAGVSGFAAAISAKEQGRRVAVLSHGVGASAVSSGAFDFGRVPSQGQPTFSSLTKSAAWRSVYERILVGKHGYPLPVETERVVLGLERALEDALPLKVQWEKPLVLPVSNGNWKSVYLAQASQAGLSMEDAVSGSLVLAYGKEWRFPAKEICKQWQAAAKKYFGRDISVLPMELSNVPAMVDAPIPTVAMRIQHDADFREAFLAALEQIGHQAGGVLIPPLFLRQTEWKQACARVPRLSECLGTLEAVPGKRLQDAIFVALKRLGIPVHLVGSLKPKIRDGEVRSVEFWNPGDTAKSVISADRFILATGKYFGGGIQLEYTAAREAIFDLPVFWSKQETRVSTRMEMPWSDRGFEERQPWAELGVWVDDSWRPLGEDKQPVYENLFACGSTLGGIDFAREQIGLGFMVFSGGQCGLMASKI